MALNGGPQVQIRNCVPATPNSNGFLSPTCHNPCGTLPLPDARWGQRCLCLVTARPAQTALVQFPHRPEATTPAKPTWQIWCLAERHQPGRRTPCTPMRAAFQPQACVHNADMIHYCLVARLCICTPTIAMDVANTEGSIPNGWDKRYMTYWSNSTFSSIAGDRVDGVAACTRPPRCTWRWPALQKDKAFKTTCVSPTGPSCQM